MRAPRCCLSSTRAAITLAIAFAIVTTAGCGSNMGMPESATTQGDDVVKLWQIFFIGAVLVSVLIWVLTSYVIISSIRRRRDAARPIPKQRQYNTRLEIIYTAIPLVVVLVLLGLSVSSGQVLTAKTTTPALDVRVVGFQWQWQFQYLDARQNPAIIIAGDPETPPTLMLPVGRKVRFTLQANDVIHSFWVPEFLEKRDLIPGIDNQIEIDVKAPGEWTGRCAEYCGFNHWLMTFKVKAVPEADYDAWARAAASRPQPIAAGGRQITSTTSSTAVPITTAPPRVTNPPISVAPTTVDSRTPITGSGGVPLVPPSTVGPTTTTTTSGVQR